MVVNKSIKKISIACLIMFLAYAAHCFVKNQTDTSGKDIGKIYSYAKKIKSDDYRKKIVKYSEYFIGTPYSTAKPKQVEPVIQDIKEYLHTLAYDPEFEYTLKAMDCVQYVEIVLALALVEENSFENKHKFQKSFEENLKKVRYKGGKDTFLTRNHFHSIDWIPNNSFLLKDITAQLQPQHAVAEAIIDKCGFIYFQEKIKDYVTAEKNAGKNFSKQDLRKILQGFSPLLACKKYTARLPYITLQDVLDNYPRYVQSFPDLSIVHIVRPNWDLTKIIGTHLNISHLGFVIKQDGKLLFRHSTSEDGKKVTEIELKDYVAKFLDSPTIKGIHVLEFRK